MFAPLRMHLQRQQGLVSKLATRVSADGSPSRTSLPATRGHSEPSN